MLSSDPMVNWGMLVFWAVFLPFIVIYCRRIIDNRTTPAPMESTPAPTEPRLAPQVRLPLLDIQRVLERARTIEVRLSNEQRREVLTFAIALCGIGKSAQHPVFKAMRKRHAAELQLFTAAFYNRLVVRFPGIGLPIDYTGADGFIDYSTEDTRTDDVINKLLVSPELCKVLCGICSIYNWELVTVYRNYCEQPGRPLQFSLIETDVFNVLFRSAGTPAA